MVNKHRRPDLSFKIEVVGERPAGYIEQHHMLVHFGLQALREIGLAGILEYGSTDANILLAKNIPAIVVGISYGGNAHREDEFIDKTHLEKGMWQLLLLTAALDEHLEKGQHWT